MLKSQIISGIKNIFIKKTKTSIKAKHNKSDGKRTLTKKSKWKYSIICRKFFSSKFELNFHLISTQRPEHPCKINLDCPPPPRVMKKYPDLEPKSRINCQIKFPTTLPTSPKWRRSTSETWPKPSEALKTILF